MAAGQSQDIVSLKVSHGLTEIMLNRPAQLDAINSALAERLVEVLSDIDRDPSIKAVLPKGAHQSRQEA